MLQSSAAAWLQPILIFGPGSGGQQLACAIVIYEPIYHVFFETNQYTMSML
jgi:hypothetical protein